MFKLALDSLSVSMSSDFCFLFLFPLFPAFSTIDLFKVNLTTLFGVFSFAASSSSLLYGELEIIVDFVTFRPLLEFRFFGNGTGKISEGVTDKPEPHANCCISNSIRILFEEGPGFPYSVDCSTSGSASSHDFRSPSFTDDSALSADITSLWFNS